MTAHGNGRALPLLRRLHLGLRGLEQLRDGAARPALGPLPLGEVLHPVALVALVALLANDWWGKLAYPGWVTGKLSDAAGLVLAPLALSSALGCALYLAAALGAPVGPALGPRRLAASIAGVALGFAACKLSPQVASGVAQALALLGGAPRIVADPTDLLALPFAAAAWWVGRAELALVPRGGLHQAWRRRRRGDARWPTSLRVAASAGAPPATVARLVQALQDEDLHAANLAMRELA